MNSFSEELRTDKLYIVQGTLRVYYMVLVKKNFFNKDSLYFSYISKDEYSFGTQWVAFLLLFFIIYFLKVHFP